MTVQALAEKIWSDGNLQKAIEAITLRAVVDDLPAVSLEDFSAIPDWFHLVRCASVFLSSDSEYYHEAGLRILHSCLTWENAENERAFAAAILAKSSNNPAVQVAIRRQLLPADVLSRLRPDLSLDIAARQIASTINIGTAREFVGNDFQQALWRALETNDWVSASAPTSAGKSYVLEKWIENIVSTKTHSTTFFIVPTRALISQVEADLRKLVGDDQPKINISSLPLSFSDPKPHNIYIYTQERFHLYMLRRTSGEPADLIVIDEAQQIGASQRGILLQQVLELAQTQFPKAKFLFASPSTDNPQSLLQFAPKGKRVRAITGIKPTVNQNLIWVEQVRGKPKKWDLSLLLSENKRAALGQISLRDRPSVTQKLPFIAWELGKAGGNVIYVNRASDAETVAEILCQFIKDEIPDPELTALSELCEKAVHPKFRLRRFVRKGVAFHYGNIPQLIRTEVERLFSSGKINFLVCTSTLIEGVNLSCRSVFMRHPKRGKSDLMKPEDFWNLAGRAGRWGKEFQGNIFCIDPLHPLEWFDGSAPRSKQKQSIRIATQRLASEFPAFMEYARSRAIGTRNRFYEYLLSYLVFRQIGHGTLASSPSVHALSDHELDALSAEIDEIIETLEVSEQIVLRNPGISPWGMNALQRHFMKTPDIELEGLLPTDPLSEATIQDDDGESRDDAIDNFVRIFSRLTEHLGAGLGSGSSAYGNALLVIEWMRGLPLSRMIDNQIRYWKRRDPSKPETTIIRETMERVERVARFETPKYLHAYLDILRPVLIVRDRGDILPPTDDFWLYLEFGVSKRTQLSLMSLGLSRSSVTSLSVFITEDNFSEADCLNWLVTNNWREFGLPRLVEMEVEAVLRRHNASPLAQP
ncbi:DEAD/DEAH box helicase [Bradyrhizobium sp. CCGUVB14]|uniref:DEAD/DEAH box helicase n=1 Tax=Bradyrhizobium sp. CCGUVB14 TaxID=2949628 RepID=UPI0020B2297C|nr:DEAD/DEAH box helicase [Bradyrhizobium sp. CCGUVB14]MCP3447198.1 DEAD/DEAH box helicase [Bradyrhizobium sp. CCGUVB14]